MESKIEDAAKVVIDFTFAVADISKEFITKQIVTIEEVIYADKHESQLNQGGVSLFVNSLKCVANKLSQ